MNHDATRMAETVELAVALARALTEQTVISLDALGVLYELDDSMRAALGAFAGAVATLRASYLSADDVAAIFKVNSTKIYRLAASGELSGSRRGGKWVFTPAAVERYVRAHTFREGPNGARERVYGDAELPPLMPTFDR